MILDKYTVFVKKMNIFESYMSKPNDMKNSFRFFFMAILATAFTASCGKPEPEPEPKPQPEPPEPKTETPVIQAQATTFLAKGDTYQLPVTITNPTSGTTLSARLVETADWISLGTPGAEGVPVILSDNLSASRSAKVDLS